MQASGQEKGNFVLQYKYIPEILEKRDPHRQGHLDAIKKGVSSVWVKHGKVGDFAHLSRGCDRFYGGDLTSNSSNKRGLPFQIAEDKIVVAGAIADPVDGGLLVFGNVTKDEVCVLVLTSSKTNDDQREAKLHLLFTFLPIALWDSLSRGNIVVVSRHFKRQQSTVQTQPRCCTISVVLEQYSASVSNARNWFLEVSGRHTREHDAIHRHIALGTQYKLQLLRGSVAVLVPCTPLLGVVKAQD